MSQTMEDLVGKYVSKKYVRQQILKQSIDEIDRLDKEIEDEKNEGGGDDEDGGLDDLGIDI